MPANEVEKDYRTFCHFISLWEKENPIKTTKLQFLLLANTLLISAVHLNGGLVEENWALYLFGAVFSLIWTLSIGRTSLFQKIWQNRMKELALRYPADARFQILNNQDAKSHIPGFLRFFGGVSSKYYLIGAPVVLFLGWTFLVLRFAVLN